VTEETVADAKAAKLRTMAEKHFMTAICVEEMQKCRLEATTE